MRLERGEGGHNVVMARVREVLAGRYELLDVLGRGGMGVVYRANDSVLDRTVAVKVLPLDRADDPAVVARFQREALAAAALSHPNIVAVFDTGQDEDTRYIVMEYLAGESLAQLVRRRGPLPAHETVQIGTQIARALAAAHRAGIVHRDIKSANVMLDEHGTVKVLDFGIARSAASTSLTQTAMVMGSASYLAPEVIRGQSADARSDIYALGCVLYELLTGRPPFTGELPAAILHQHNTAVPRAAKDLNPAIPAGLDALIMQMLAKNPSQRPQRASQLVSALPASLRDSTTTATTPLAPTGGPLTESTSLMRHWPRLGRTERLTMGLAALLVIVGLGIALLGSTGSTNKKTATHKKPAIHAQRTKSRSATAATAPAPRTVPAAVGALTSLTTRDLQTGTIDQSAAQAILSHLQDILTAYENGRLSGALQDLTDLTSQIAQLSQHGDIKASALPGINAAITNLRSALQRATPRATTTTAATRAPAPTPVTPATRAPAHTHGKPATPRVHPHPQKPAARGPAPKAHGPAATHPGHGPAKPPHP